MTGGIKPVDIIVPCLNNLQYTRKCYERLKKNTQISFKLTFVDNGSRLPTQNYLKN
ncbi:MAG: glycosyltransferase [Elusimicrobia bacterium]|nr:glycosyltransferase [Elusimicrobiota bacterium]